jgi:hypothetical protein
VNEGDGDLDLVTNNLNEKASLYRNTASEKTDHSFLRVTLDGPPRNPQGRGAKVTLYTGDEQQHARLSVVRGYKSSVPATLHFGLADAEMVDSLVVAWPDARRERLRSVSVNQEVTL